MLKIILCMQFQNPIQQAATHRFFSNLGESTKVFQNTVDNSILLPKLFWPTVRKSCSRDWEELLKFEAEGREKKFW